MRSSYNLMNLVLALIGSIKLHKKPKKSIKSLEKLTKIKTIWKFINKYLRAKKTLKNSKKRINKIKNNYFR